jgi:hypothetical protein
MRKETPWTSWPCSISRPAATELSTPPLMATATFLVRDLILVFLNGWN